jgi:hypothetical protein
MKDQPVASYAARVELAKTIGTVRPDKGRYMIDLRGAGHSETGFEGEFAARNIPRGIARVKRSSRALLIGADGAKPESACGRRRPRDANRTHTYTFRLLVL